MTREPHTIQIGLDPRDLKDIIEILHYQGWHEGWFENHLAVYRTLVDALEQWRSGVGYPDE